MSDMVRVVLLRAGKSRPEWTAIDVRASGPELSLTIGSSQPECLVLAPRLVMWYDGTPFCSEANAIGQFMRCVAAEAYTGNVLVVGSRDPRDSWESSESDECLNSTPEQSALAAVFTEEFVSALFASEK